MAAFQEREGYAGLKINQVVSVFSELNPAGLELFRQRYPELKDVLSEGVVLGRLQQGDSLYSLLEFASEALAEVEKQLPCVFETLGRKLIWIRRFRVVGASVSVISCAGIVAALYGESQLAALITAGINGVASTMTVLANNVEGGVLTGTSGNVERFVHILKIDRTVFEVRQNLALALVADDISREEVMRFVQAANSAAADFRHLYMSLKTI